VVAVDLGSGGEILRGSSPLLGKSLEYRNLQDPNSAIHANEELARFVFYKNHVRIDGTLKPDGFIPHPDVDTSATRHNRLGERKIWIRGNNVARQTQRRLIGRADACASAYSNNGLQINPDPVKCNPQHVNVGAWPTDKASQKNRAQLISKESVFKPSIEISDTQVSIHVGQFVTVKGIVTQIVTTHKSNMLFNLSSLLQLSPHGSKVALLF